MYMRLVRRQVNVWNALACMSWAAGASGQGAHRPLAPTIALLLLLIWSPVSVTQTAVDPGLLCEGKHGCIMAPRRRTNTPAPSSWSGVPVPRFQAHSNSVFRGAAAYCGAACVWRCARRVAGLLPGAEASMNRADGKRKRCCCLGPFAGGLAHVSLVKMLPVIASLQPAASGGHAQGQG